MPFLLFLFLSFFSILSAETGSTIGNFQDRIIQFTNERGWVKFYAPANIARNLIVEINELIDLFVWIDGIENQKTNLATRRPLPDHELADVLYNLLLLDIYTSRALPQQVTFDALQQQTNKSLADLKDGSDELLFGATDLLKKLKTSQQIDGLILPLIKIVFQIANALEIDAATALTTKIQANAAKYPASNYYQKSKHDQLQWCPYRAF